jgi:hypothetical protein
MADLKISALTSATTPLAGTEVLPIVQSSTTKKVSIDDVTAGRAVAAKNLTLTDNTTGEQFTINSSSSGGTSQSFRSTSTNGRNWRVGGNFVIGSGEFSIYDATGSAERFRINAGGDIVAPNNNLVIGTSGKGIDFSATSGTGTSELLADYEEGTWTPVGTWTTQGSGTSSGNAYYTKVGRTVTLLMYITATKGTASGDFTVTGVPYAPATAAACAVRIAGMGALTKYVGVNIVSTTMGFLLQDQATTYGTNATAAEMATDCYIQVTCTYNI